MAAGQAVGRSQYGRSQGEKRDSVKLDDGAQRRAQTTDSSPGRWVDGESFDVLPVPALCGADEEAAATSYAKSLWGAGLVPRRAITKGWSMS